MKFFLTAIGTRGDVEPFVGIGAILLRQGHEVSGAFPEQYRDLAESEGITFHSLGSEFIELIDGELGRAVMGGGMKGIAKIKALIKLAKESRALNKEMLLIQEEVVSSYQPDIIIHHTKALYPTIWAVDHPDQTLLVSPTPYLHYSKGHTHVAFHSDWGTALNKLSYKIAHFGLRKTIQSCSKWTQTPRSRKEILHVLNTQRVVYSLSPYLFTRPTNWSERISIEGYVERDKQLRYSPPSDLVDFLERHERVLFITFGSMSNPDPVAKTNSLLRVLHAHRIPAIINIAAGGLVSDQESDPTLIYYLDRIPYDWILPRVHAIIHHGGSGTTHLGLKYACPTMIIPHIPDQYVFDQMIEERGLGPRGVQISKLSTETITDKIIDLYQNESYLQKAKEISTEMLAETVEENILSIISDLAPPN